jgi:hypothetical protein
VQLEKVVKESSVSLELVMSSTTELASLFEK